MKKIRQVYANRGIEAEYRKRLEKLVNAMSKSVMYWLMVDFASKSPVEMAKAIQKRIKQWKKIFGDKSNPVALWFVKSIKKHTETGMRTAFKESGITYPMNIPTSIVNAIKIENDDLIKSIPEKYFTGIQTVCMLAILYGWDKDKFKQELEKRTGITERRAKLIARDQTHKTNQLFKLSLCKSVGIKYAQWVYTYRSEKPRESHIQMNGTIFDISVGCYDPKVNRFIFPAELINCYHKDTEVMTQEGFKKFYELSGDDKILTLNPQTKNLEYANIKRFYSKRIDNIAHIKGKSLDMAVDPNHTFFTYKYVEHKPRQYTLEPKFTKGVENLGRKFNKFYGSSQWIGEEPEFIQIGKRKIKTDVFCKMMGYWLSEGHIDHKRKTNAVHISQFKYVDKMYEDLKSLGFHKNKGCLRLYDKDIAEYLQKFGYSYEKYVPEEILNLSPKYIRIFLNAYALGDGTPSKKIKFKKGFAKTNQNYYTSSKRMMDTLVECIIKSGKAVSVHFYKRKGKVIRFKNGEYETKTDLYWITEKENVFMQLATTKTTIEPYDDFVYDIEVDKNHTLLVKYGSCIHWNSNCQCDFRPVIEDYDGEIQKTIEKNRYYQKIASWE